MKILILGGNGFIGSYIADALINSGHSLIIYDRKIRNEKIGLEKVEFVKGNFSDFGLHAHLLEGVDIVFHCIGPNFPVVSNLTIKADIQDNLLSTISLLDLMIKNGNRRIVYISSGGTVYGHTEKVPILENQPLNPINSYGIIKVAIENYLLLYNKLYGLQPIILRPSNPFGSRQVNTSGQGIISTIFRRLRDDREIEIWGDGEIIRDYFYVEDLAELCTSVIKSNVAPMKINVGSGQGRSINDVISAVELVTKRKCKIVYKKPMDLEIKNSVLDISFAKNEFNWSPKREFFDALTITWESILEEKFTNL